jgi:hypothetical protein
MQERVSGLLRDKTRALRRLVSLAKKPSTALSPELRSGCSGRQARGDRMDCVAGRIGLLDPASP